MQLMAHPATPGPDIALTVDVSRTAELRFAYALHGDLDAIVLPPLVTPAFADELWRHTCFEAFIGSDRNPAYYEYNFSPSGRWAVYGFADYRRARAVDPAALAPTVDWQHRDRLLTLGATVPLARLADLADVSLRVGVSAVIEARDGTLSYLALHHPAGRPDFHHAAARTLVLPARRGDIDR